MPTVEEVSQKVQRILADNFRTRLGREGDFFIDAESTYCRVRCVEWNPDYVMIRLEIPILFGVPISDELCRWIALDDPNVFGTYGLYADDSGKEGSLWFDHNLLGNTIDTDELCSAVALCLRVGDGQDDELKKRFGGRLASDE